MFVKGFLTVPTKLRKIYDVNGINNILHKIYKQIYDGKIRSVWIYHAGYEQFNGGWLGVDIFFVISGYLISNIILSELQKGDF